MRTEEGAVDATDEAYTGLSTSETERTDDDGTVTPLVQVSVTSARFGVRFTWFMLKTTVVADGIAPAAHLKTGQVNVICAHPHVQGFRSEQDFGRDGTLYNYGVVTVGTDDGSAALETRVRMDAIGQPAVFAAIEHLWTQLVEAGAS